MPTYEYACKECGHHLEVVQSFHEEPIAVCPSCGGQLKKVFGNIGIVFKGSGFYKTDSRSKSSATKAASPEPSASSSESKSETPSSAPSSKPESSPSPASSDGGTSKAAAAAS